MLAVVCTVLLCSGLSVTRAAAVLETEHLTAVRNAGGCLWDWTRLGNRCFKFVNTPKKWPDAEKDCISKGANLASVHSQREYLHIEQMITEQTENVPQTWLGGYDAVQEGVWLWSDGTEWNFYTWAYGDPDNAGGNQNCLQMNYGARRLWDDDQCYDERPYICAMTI